MFFIICDFYTYAVFETKSKVHSTLMPKKHNHNTLKANSNNLDGFHAQRKRKNLFTANKRKTSYQNFLQLYTDTREAYGRIGFQIKGFNFTGK